MKITDSLLSKARYFGSEFQANPGSDRGEYLDSLAMDLGKAWWLELPTEIRAPLMEAFREGIAREKRLQ